jgi:hypothetical protein
MHSKMNNEKIVISAFNLKPVLVISVLINDGKNVNVPGFSGDARAGTAA